MSLALLFIGIAVLGLGLIGRSSDYGSKPALHSLQAKIASLCWISYAPADFNPKKNRYPSDGQIREDLTILRQSGFRGLVTHGSEKTLGRIPRIAKEVGFDGIIMGVWDPTSEEELTSAEKASQFVDGYVVGHVGLADRYDLSDVQKAMERLRAKTTKPITTTERIDRYGRSARLARLGDWLFPDMSIYWNEKREARQAYQWVVEQYVKLRAYSDKPILLKTVGFPSAGHPRATDEEQSEFFRLLLQNARLRDESIRFVYFEAFDQPWKDMHPIEPHWGLFRADKSAKTSARYIWGRYLDQGPKPQASGSSGFPWDSVLLSGLLMAASLFFIVLFGRTPTRSDQIGEVDPDDKQGMPVPGVRINAFGGLSVERDGVTIQDSLGPQRRKLLTLLVAVQPCSVEKIAKIIDPGNKYKKQVVKSFRTLLDRLRRDLQPEFANRGVESCIICRRGRVFFNLSACRIDVLDFEEHIRNAEKLEARGDLAAAKDEYSKAIELHRGDLLHGETASFGEKEIQDRRERIQAAYKNASARLSALP